ncbi:ricin-type beta-trefoil lectin domain protein [Kribbella sp. CA-293567]|uniref:ricin-type beta-trefoil lectin domain protein n=1 Tax=Kribbella sp. CA-293567 TaxID=3002436 RepID=UPI0022DD30C0|nr:ricin-type beta-trefoil lectin domain protein [Kribbella sp. CA-293567]WBQ04474.1 ricin-type beta-trefoil lectin domain protein [Kribbella sp. CA-293567]
MIFHRTLTRVGVTTLALAMAAATSVTAAAQPAAPAAAPTAAAAAPDLPVGTPKQLVSSANRKMCLTFAVTPNGIPTAVMIKCNKGSKGKIQQWIYTPEGQLQVAMSKDVGGDLPHGACLDTVADLATVKGAAPMLVMPCRVGDGQKWNYDQKTGALINAANGKALSSMLGLAKQARPTSTVPFTGTSDQKWRGAAIPMETLLGAIIQLLDALLEALGLEMPDEYETSGKQLVNAVGPQLPIPDQLKQLPKEMVRMAG